MVDQSYINEKGSEAVKQLRLKKLQNGQPFLIYSADLPKDQCYLEYPDGSIKLASFTKGAHDFIIIRELPENESLKVRVKYNLPILF
jgi:hypothetical protein